jgi:hypothetical protein
MIVVYRIDPIDFWDGWHPLSELPLTVDLENGVWLPLAEVDQFLARAQALARRIGWEGDIRGGPGAGNGPFWAPLPSDRPGVLFMVAWKQDNNGETFVASPRELPWLYRDPHDRIDGA